jgi:hypothetical protein
VIARQAPPTANATATDAIAAAWAFTKPPTAFAAVATTCTVLLATAATLWTAAFAAPTTACAADFTALTTR